MATPASTTRQTPAGIMLEDGSFSKFAFAADPDVSLWEMESKPPGVDGGEAIDITTHHNVALRTSAARKLKNLTEATFKCGYDPAVVTQLLALINVEGAITQYFPDGSKEDYFGYLRVVEFDALVPGNLPTCNATIHPTNRDPVARTEQGPVLTSVVGT